MNLSERLARWFLLVAKRLDPAIEIEKHKVVENYEQKKIGLTYILTKKDIKEYRFKDGARMSVRDGKRGIINDTRKKIRQHIINGIDSNRLIEYSIAPEGDGFTISGQLNVCAKLDNGKDKEDNT